MYFLASTSSTKTLDQSKATFENIPEDRDDVTQAFTPLGSDPNLQEQEPESDASQPASDPDMFEPPPTTDHATPISDAAEDQPQVPLATGSALFDSTAHAATTASTASTASTRYDDVSDAPKRLRKLRLLRRSGRRTHTSGTVSSEDQSNSKTVTSQQLQQLQQQQQQLQEQVKDEKAATPTTNRKTLRMRLQERQQQQEQQQPQEVDDDRRSPLDPGHVTISSDDELPEISVLQPPSPQVAEPVRERDVSAAGASQRSNASVTSSKSSRKRAAARNGDAHASSDEVTTYCHNTIEGVFMYISFTTVCFIF